MKKFLLGVLSATMVFSLSVSALAISGRMTIEVDPIAVQVNGVVFQPTDVNGNEVPVFAYNGTTYAPLRALAEVYGLEVGYDPATNMATVVDLSKPVAHVDGSSPAPGGTSSDNMDAEYQAFKSVWQFVGVKPSDHIADLMIYSFSASSEDISDDELMLIYSDNGDYINRMVVEQAIAGGAQSGTALCGKFTNGTQTFFIYPYVD